MPRLNRKRDFQKVIPHNRFIQDGIVYDSMGDPLPGQEKEIKKAFGAPEPEAPADTAPDDEPKDKKRAVRPRTAKKAEAIPESEPEAPAEAE